jgi:hypothetical protein
MPKFRQSLTAIAHGRKSHENEQQQARDRSITSRTSSQATLPGTGAGLEIWNGVFM